MTNILVTYASKHNATAEIATAIGAVLRQSDTFHVDIRPVETVEDIAPYAAVVLGSAVYAGQWQSSAADFLKQHNQALARRPVWLFSSGPTGEGDPKTLVKGWTFPQALQPLADHIKPRDIAVFHGKLDPRDLNLLERGIVKMVHAPTGDFRDWTVIREWASSIVQTLLEEKDVSQADVHE
jgi:menaquinone-dependent protoporphyrinogen oxidase